MYGFYSQPLKTVQVFSGMASRWMGRENARLGCTSVTVRCRMMIVGTLAGLSVNVMVQP